MNQQTAHPEPKWLYPSPFIRTWKISSEHIDHYNHTNNVAYLARLEKLAWQHSNQLGLYFEDYQALNRAMVITHHKLHYHRASYLDDVLQCATWIEKCDAKLKLTRAFQFFNQRDANLVFSAKTDFVCVELSTGMPRKMPEKFGAIYGGAQVQNTDEHS